VLTGLVFGCIDLVLLCFVCIYCWCGGLLDGFCIDWCLCCVVLGGLLEVVFNLTCLLGFKG